MADVAVQHADLAEPLIVQPVEGSDRPACVYEMESFSAVRRVEQYRDQARVRAQPPRRRPRPSGPGE